MTDKIYIAHQRESDGEQQFLEDHLIGVSMLAKNFAKKIGLETQGELIGLLHDFGKYSDQFQNYIQSAVGLINPDEDDYVDARGLKGKVDHSTAGAQAIWHELSKKGTEGQIVGQILALCIASHHSGLIDCLSSDFNNPAKDKFTERMNKPENKAHFHEALSKMDEAVSEKFKTLIDDPNIVKDLIASLTSLIDPKNQNKTLFKFKIGLLVRFLFSCLIDADRLNTADFEKPVAAQKRLNGQYIDFDTLIDRLEKRLDEFKADSDLNKLRSQISDHCHENADRNQAIFTLSVPTGGGKTLASLRFALHHAKKHQLERIIYVIPFTSIIDQNAEETRKILEPKDIPDSLGNVVLEHHSNLMPEEQTWKDKILTENWDAPIIYTTSVQFLDTLFSAGTRGARRMHQLSKAVIIFDEVQTIPINCVHIFCNAINFLTETCGSSVVLCTATQPLLNEVDTQKGAVQLTKNSELMPDTKMLFQKLKRVEVSNKQKPGGWSHEEIAKLAITELKESGSCLVITNTKNAAQTLYKLCQSETDVHSYHLSTNMCPTHRKEELGKIRKHLAQNKKVLCFSTQLIEAGVDVDFGSVIRFTAGLDSIAQAAGRCNRNGLQKDAEGNPKAGRVYIVNPTDENLDWLKDIKKGKESTLRIMDEFAKDPDRFDRDLIGQTAMEWYFRYYFFERSNEMDYPVSANAIGHDDSLLNLLSENKKLLEEYKRQNTGVSPNIFLRHSFMTAAKAFKAINAPTRGVIVPHGEAGKALIAGLCGAYEVEKQFELLRKAQQYTVNVFPNVLKKLQETGAVHPIQKDVDILYLKSEHYDKSFGLSLTATGEMETYCV